jgi:hypothetical protein
MNPMLAGEAEVGGMLDGMVGGGMAPILGSGAPPMNPEVGGKVAGLLEG